ncbi:MAG: carboxypeptidase regulatory-like domain-containing protein [Myxococcales bacterium]|nr:carboxypeptidase regulatory-like domain-containing protein [Myxococcales bacterium]MCB9734765.1 carboxypeptidase regulatory-like domain-containing protein [Deltaproteobacteria bacterium]
MQLSPAISRARAALRRALWLALLVALAACPGDDAERPDAADTALPADAADADAEDAAEDTATVTDTDTADDDTVDTDVGPCPDGCDDGDPCTVDRCDADACAHDPVTAAPAVTLAGVTDGAYSNAASVSPSLTLAGNAAGPPTATLDGAPYTLGATIADEGRHELVVTVPACVGDPVVVSATFTLDRTPPTVTATLSPPANAAGWSRATTTVTFAASDALSGVATAPDPVVVAAEGADQAVSGEAVDRAGNRASATAIVSLDRTPPAVRFTLPTGVLDGGTVVVGANLVSVAGEADDDALSGFVSASLVPSDARAPMMRLTPGELASDYPLVHGRTSFVLTARDVADNVGTASITVVVDDSPPRVTIHAPLDGAVVDAATVDVTGVAQDLVVGTVSSADLVVTVNGAVAAVADGRFVARGVPLAPGPNAIEAVVTDPVGLEARDAVTVTRVDPGAVRLAIVSGDGQLAVAGDEAAEPLVVRVTDGDGAPLASRDVVFAVTDNDAHLFGADAVRIGPTARTLLARTDEGGLAAAGVRLGTRAGAAVNRVSASTAGARPVHFHLDGEPAPASEVHVRDGQNQTGSPLVPLPMPLAVRVTDGLGNPVAGETVHYEVIRGDGTLAGGAATDATSDADGLARVAFVPGPTEGWAAHAVRAWVDGVLDGGGTEAGAVFQASAFATGPVLLTSLRGRVLDEAERPVAGARVTIAGYREGSGGVLTDERGGFLIEGAPPGYVHVVVDASEVTPAPPGVGYPSMGFDLHLVQGVANAMDRPVYLVALRAPTWVDGLTDAVLTLPEMPGFELRVPRGTTVTFPDGAHEGWLSLTQVHFDQAPMQPSDGLQSRVLVTIQPTGTTFDPPAPFVMPNADGYAPGQKIDLYSYDHDLEAFVQIGTGSVSADGTRVASDPGVGVVKAGWHCGNRPGGTGGSAGISAKLAVTGGSLANGGIRLTASGAPGKDTVWSFQTCGDLELDTPEGACADKGSCPAVVTNDEAAYGRVRVDHICTESGKTATAYATVRVCEAPDEPFENTLDVDLDPVTGYVMDMAAGFFGWLCDIDNPEYMKDETRAGSTGCCPGCPGEVAAQYTVTGTSHFAGELECNPFDVLHYLTERAKDIMGALGYVSGTDIELGVQVALNARIDASRVIEVDECLGTACGRTSLDARFGVRATAGGEAVIGGFTVGRLMSGAEGRFSVTSTSNCDRYCTAGCSEGASYIFDFTVLNGILGLPDVHHRSPILCPGPIQETCEDTPRPSPTPACEDAAMPQCGVDFLTPPGSGTPPGAQPELAPPMCVARDCDRACESDSDCADDGVECTFTKCVEGTCYHPVEPGTCLIDGQCYADGEENPANECQVCDGDAIDSRRWSIRDPGYACGGSGCLTCDPNGNCWRPNDDICGPCERCDVEFGECVLQGPREDVKNECPRNDCASGYCDGEGACAVAEEGTNCGGQCETCDPFGRCVYDPEDDAGCGFCGTCFGPKECGYQAPGLDLHDECPAGNAVCQPGYCDGFGGCFQAEAGTECSGFGECDGGGQCVE